MKKILFTSIAILGFFGAFAQMQEKCGANYVLNQQLEDPENRAKYEAFQEAIHRYVSNPMVKVQRENGVRIIPVVFHILHAGGPENIGLNKVQQQLDVLNEDYRRLNPDTVNTPQRFYGDTEYTSFVFHSDSILGFVDDSSYIRLNNRYGESFAFHFNNGTGGLADTLVPNFDNVIEINISNNADTSDLASALTDAINAQNGLIAEYIRDTVFTQAPNFTVNGNFDLELSYTTQPTFTTSWNGTSVDTTWSNQLTVILYQDVLDPFLPTDTLYVYDASTSYNEFDGSGNIIGTQEFVEEGLLELSFVSVPVSLGEFRVNVSTDGLGYTDDVLVSRILQISSTITQQGKYVPADCNIEFRLATKDPLGNCTDGVVRVFTSKTNNANDGTGFKGESYWNAYSYLNIWVVTNIDKDIPGGGTVLGYAQFPATGLLSTDGIAVIASNIDTRNSGGRTATHEVGHWLSLIHIWGDATCGSDDVLDTPTHNGPNYGICGNNPGYPQFGGGSTYFSTPYNVPGCDPNNPDGEMFDNYMDYSDDKCMNIFTRGQKARMDFTLEGDGTEPGVRSYLISQENLEATGVADPYTQPECAPISSFYFQQSADFANQRMICAGENVRFEESTYNGAVSDYLWTFEGGSPATDTDNNPIVTYNDPGQFDVSLQVSNSVGSDTRTETDMVIVSSTTAQYQNDWGYVDSFWGEQDFLDDYVVFNQDGSANKWEWFYGPDGGSTGWESVRMFNMDNNAAEIDELVSPSYNLSTLSNPSLKFRFSGAAVDNTPNDELRVMASSDCGETWSTRATYSGYELTNSGLVVNSYRPNGASTWTDVNVSLGSSFANKANVRIKFRWTSGGRANNFYIDDITLSGSPLGMEDLERQIDLNVAPNPTVGVTTVTMSLVDAATVSLEMVDVLGKDVKRLVSREMTNGTHRFDIDMSGYTSGIYYLRIMVDNSMVVKKVVKN